MGIIIGVTGTLSSGKDEFSRYLREKGFIHISLSDMLRDELSSRGDEITRDSLRAIGNELRENRGLGILGKMAAARMQPESDYVVTSIRNPEEIEELRRLPNFYLLRLDAPIETRFRRALLRNREEEKRTLEEFRRSEEVELSSENPASQQLRECMGLADGELINDGTLPELHEKIDRLLVALR